jgi:ribosomal protein S19E (S16A)
LEAAGYVETLKTRGRKITREGRRLLQELTEELVKELVKDHPGFEKYQK